MRIAAAVLMSMAFLACSPLPSAVSNPDFKQGEHLLLGDMGYQAACADQSQLCRAALIRNDAKQSFSYGELVAFSGDFYRVPEDLYYETKQSYFKWNRNDVDSTKEHFREEVEAIENYVHGHSDGEYPDFDLNYVWNYPDYLGLALDNVPHFGFYNMIAYIEHHGRALSLALSAHDKFATQPEEALNLLTQALFTNAFADHFLTDGFASGHIRTPRMQMLNWSNDQGMSERTAATLAKVIHDRDGEVRSSGEHGMSVTNTRGDSWLTRCDEQLFWKSTMQDPSIQLPAKAVEVSVREILTAYEQGMAVNGVYAATEYVPFPSASEPPLTELFAEDLPDAEYEKIMQQMAFYVRIKLFSGIDKPMLKKLTASLPEIMQNFRNDVQAELVKKPLLQQHLPVPYMEAFRAIQ